MTFDQIEKGLKEQLAMDDRLAALLACYISVKVDKAFRAAASSTDPQYRLELLAEAKGMLRIHEFITKSNVAVARRADDFDVLRSDN